MGGTCGDTSHFPKPDDRTPEMSRVPVSMERSRNSLSGAIFAVGFPLVIVLHALGAIARPPPPGPGKAAEAEAEPGKRLLAHDSSG